MAVIELENVKIQFPTHGRVTARPGQESDGDRVAGRLSKDASGRVVIKALDGVSLSLRDGERLGIIGSNGSGKTTLLKTMGGIYPPASGRVYVKGRLSTMLSLGLGMQGDASGLRNIFLSGIVAGASRKQIKSVIPDIVDFTALGDYIHMPMRTYSQGMAMRLKFACATAFQPEIILVDEWIGAGDADFQEKAQARLERMLKNVGIVVTATHNRSLVKRVTNRVLWLERGEIRGLGPTDEILALKDEHDRRNAEARASGLTKGEPARI